MTTPNALYIDFHDDIEFVELLERTSQDAEELAKFRQLRLGVLVAQEKLITERVFANLVPDEEEYSAGAFREQIEPQCREAIFTIRGKGYRTGSSGFAAITTAKMNISGAAQTADGGFYNLAQQTEETLTTEGFFMGNPSSVGFYPTRADIGEITDRWNHLADILPDLGSPAEPNMVDMADFYRMIRATTPWIDWAEVPLAE